MHDREQSSCPPTTGVERLQRVLDALERPDLPCRAARGRRRLGRFDRRHGRVPRPPLVPFGLGRGSARRTPGRQRPATAASQLAHGSIVLFVDDDVVATPDLVEEHLASSRPHGERRVGDRTDADAAATSR